MQINSFIVSLLLGSLWLMAQNASAFGDRGHKIIAAMAYEKLTPKSKAAIDQLLTLDEDQLTEKDFISRATWADKYRDSDRNSSKKRYHSTRNWHFIDLDLEHPNLRQSCPSLNNSRKIGVASQGSEKDCVVHKIEEFSDELKNPKMSIEEKILALKFLIHFVGDLHQPLHTSTRNDRGGNQQTVRFFSPRAKRFKQSNLHSFWDHEVLSRLDKKTDVTATRLNLDVNEQDIKRWSKGSARDWALESNQIAKTVVYDFKGLKDFKDDENNVVYVLSAKYLEKCEAVGVEQLKKASVRLAKLLNEAFDPAKGID